MTGETPNPLDVLNEAAWGFQVPREDVDAALAQVEALAEAAQAVVAFVPKYQQVLELQDALVPFAAHKDTNHA